VALLRLCRPAWSRRAGDDWRDAADMDDAVRLIGSAPRRVLLTVGRHDLAPFRLAGAHHYVVRSIDPPKPDLLPAGAALVLDRGPYGFAEERAMLEAHRIEMLVTKNSGGPATAAKLEAARALGLPVVMVARPAEPLTPVETAGAALDWLGSLHHDADRGA
jgi:precorrin-6A/cobalt-precorrin-6A reductase